MKKYVIYHSSFIDDTIEKGYYQGIYYIFQGSRYGCFTRYVSHAKKYSTKKRAENAIKSLTFANAEPRYATVKEIEVEE